MDEPYLPRVSSTTVVCVGSGPSLSAVDVHLLAKWPQIAINDTWWVTPKPVGVFAADPKWWNREFDAVRRAHPSAACWTLEYGAPDGVLRLHRSGQTGLDVTAPRLRSGGHSGYAAVNLAFHLLGGADGGPGRRIVLTGYDMQPQALPDGAPQHHFFGAHPDGSHVRYEMWRGLYTELHDALAVHGVALVNATRSSALTLPTATAQDLVDRRVTV